MAWQIVTSYWVFFVYRVIYESCGMVHLVLTHLLTVAIKKCQYNMIATPVLLKVDFIYLFTFYF